MGLDQDLKTDPPCHPRACAIQDCIQKNNYDESKCQKQASMVQPVLKRTRADGHTQIDALYECCNAFYQKDGDDAKTVSCPKAGLLRLKMKQRAQGL